LSFRTFILVLACVFPAATLSGCLTMRRGSLQVIPVNSTPPGATVIAKPGGQSTVTPGELTVARRYQQSLTFELEGYQSKTVHVERHASSGLWRNAVWIHPVGWIIGLVVDLSTGSGYDLEPESSSVSLLPVPEPDSTPSGQP